jgi:hypothetical protein
MWQFPSLFSEGRRFCSYLLKVEGAVNNFVMLSGSFPIFSLSNHTTFSQTQTGATVPLKMFLSSPGDHNPRNNRGFEAIFENT